jgi:hypothetical protein
MARKLKESQLIGLVPFSKENGNINLKGRPKKVLTELQERLESEGHHPVTKAEFISYMTTIIALPDDKWNEVKELPSTPKFIRLLMQSVEKDKFYKVIPDILDRIFGKAKEEFILNHNGTGANNLITPIQVIINGQIKE